MTPRPKPETAEPSLAEQVADLTKRVEALEAVKVPLPPHEQPIRHSFPVQIDN